jgi:hypothetical protein
MHYGNGKCYNFLGHEDPFAATEKSFEGIHMKFDKRKFH